jgi:hypothetical protein
MFWGRVKSKENVTEGTMAETEPMTVDERRKCLHKVRLRCWVALPKKERSRLLDEARAIPGVHRKSLMRPVQGELAGACAVCQPPRPAPGNSNPDRPLERFT